MIYIFVGITDILIYLVMYLQLVLFKEMLCEDNVSA